MAASQYSLINKSDKYQFLDMINDIYNICEFAHKSIYEIPEGEDKSTFSYDSMKNADYTELKKSEKFTPALYHEKDGIWEGGSTSQFSPVMTFKLWEKFSDSCLEVSESMEVNGKKTFGYDEPIIYKRV